MTRANLVGGVLAAIILAVPCLALAPAMQDERRMTMCAMNLKSLWQSCLNYASQYGRPNGILQPETGTDFWLKLKKTPKPIIDRTEVYYCPLAGHDPTLDQTSYRGPGSNANKMEDESPVGADFDGNHGAGRGGNVMSKMGDIRPYKADDAFWKKCDEVLAGTPPLTKAQAIEKRIADLEKAVKELTELVKELKARVDKSK